MKQDEAAVRAAGASRRRSQGTSDMRCNLCGGTAFVDMPKRPRVRCAQCGSLERTRVAGLFLRGLDRPAPGASILHFAPERGLSSLLSEIGGEGYRAVDIDPKRFPGLRVEPFDLCRDVFDLPEGSLDLIVHNHVLEHIECNYSVVLIRLLKALKPTGVMLFSVPILPGDFSDELLDAPMQAKLARFGESLHVRRFSAPLLQQTLGMIIRLPDRYDLLRSFDEATLVEANIPRHHWQAYTGTSILRVTPQDLRA